MKFGAGSVAPVQKCCTEERSVIGNVVHSVQSIVTELQGVNYCQCGKVPLKGRKMHHLNFNVFQQKSLLDFRGTSELSLPVPIWVRTSSGGIDPLQPPL